MLLTIKEVSKLLKRLEEMHQQDKIFELGDANASKLHRDRGYPAKITPLAFTIMRTLEKHIPTMSEEVGGSASSPDAISVYISTAKEFLKILQN